MAFFTTHAIRALEQFIVAFMNVLFMFYFKVVNLTTLSLNVIF